MREDVRLNTLACGLGRHHLCPKIVKPLGADPRPCVCTCHLEELHVQTA